MTTTESKEPLPVFRWLHAFWESGCDSGTGYTLLAIWKFADNRRLTARPTRETLAEMTGYSVRTIERHITYAAEHGWIERAERGFTNRSTQYLLTFGRLFPAKGATRGTQSKRIKSATGDTQSTESVPPVTGECATRVAPTALRTTSRTASSAGEVEDQGQGEGPKVGERTASEILAHGIRDLADEHRVKERYQFLGGGGFVRKDYAGKLSREQRRTQHHGETTTPARADFPDVGDENYERAKAKNLIDCGWLAQKQRELTGKNNPERWLAAAIEGEPARRITIRRQFQEI